MLQLIIYINSLEKIYKGQEVEFYPNIVPFGNERYLVARFIDSYKDKVSIFDKDDELSINESSFNKDLPIKDNIKERIRKEKDYFVKK